MTRERGSALVIALVMIVMVGTLATVTLTYGGTSLRASSTAVGPDRYATYAGGGAIDLATEYLQKTATAGVAGGSVCGNPTTFNTIVNVPASGNAPAVDVRCQPTATSGASTGGNGGVADPTPKYSLLALGTNNNMPGPYNNNPRSATTVWDTSTWAERGIDVQKSSTGGNAITTLTGNVFSNAPVRKSASSGQLAATGTISARGACESVTPCTVVPYSTAATADPGFPSRTPDLTPRAVPSCPSSTAVTFQPGWYSSASALNNLFATCKNKDFWFRPGVYYFDFRDTGGGTQCRPTSAAASDALHEWCIGPYADSLARVVGGVPVGWAPNQTPVTIDTDMAGGSSYPEVWSNQANAKVIDGAYATFTWSSLYTDTFMGAIYPATTVPTSAQSISSVSIDATSQVSSGTATRRLWVMYGDASNIFSLTTCPGYPATVSSNSVTVTGLETCLDTPAKVNSAVIAMEYDVSTSSGTARFDGAKMHVTYVPAGVGRAPFPSGCDPSSTGVQWIFGGDSRVYVSDGSVELCAGPNPAGSATNQQIAVYGVPPVDPIVPTATGTVSGQTFTTINNASNALTMGEQSGITNASIRVTPKCGTNPWNVSCTSGSGSGYAYGSMRLDFAPGQFSLPVNTKLETVELHASYNQSSATFDSDYSPEFVVHQYQNPSGWSCAADMSMPATNATQQFWKAIPTSCLTAARLASGFSIEWRARVWADCSSNNCGGAQTRTLDGMEVRVALDPTSASTAVVMPEDGCIAPFPNEYESNSGDLITNRYGYNNWDDDSAPDCALLMWDAIPRTTGTASEIGCYSGQVSLQGTLYAPGAAVDMDQAGPKAAGCNPASPAYTAWSYPVFGRGAIVRTLRIKGMRASAGQSIGGCGSASCGGTVQDRTVTLQARINGTTKVTAKVVFPAAGGPPDIQSWTVS